MDAATFAEVRPDLPDGGRWTELVDGEPVMLAPPEPLHGTFVLNLSKALADAAAKGAAAGRFGAGAVFEVGVRVAEGPDTIRFPAASLFAERVFEQLDATVADAVPAVVVEVPGTPDRRRDAARRVEEYHAAGVGEVWVADIAESTVTVAAADDRPTLLSGDDRLTVGVLPAFGPTVAELFAVPAWWTDGPKSKP